MGLLSTKDASHFGCVYWSILLLSWFSLPWTVFNFKTLDASFVVVCLETYAVDYFCIMLTQTVCIYENWYFPIVYNIHIR